MSIHFDLVDLKLFAFIAEEASLTRAAARVHMSLPAASIRIKNLEDSLGIKLLNRANQGVTLRPPGQALLHHALQILQQLEHLNDDLQEYVQGVKGHVRILANTTAITEFLPAVLRSYLSSHPDVNVDLHERLSNDIVRAVSDGTADIGIVAGNVRTEGLQILPYRKDHLVLATSTSHPLARHDDVSFAETLTYDFIGLHEASAIHAFLNRAASELHVPLKIRIQVNSFEAICRMVDANVGIGILPASAARRHAQNLAIRFISLRDEWASRNLVICTRELQSLPSFARELIDLLVEDGRAPDTPDKT